MGKLALTGSGLANPNEWKEVKLSNNQSFVKFFNYGAEVIAFEQIVFFGHSNEIATFTLKEDPVEEDTLRITHKANTIEYTENLDSSCRVFGNKIYAFP